MQCAVNLASAAINTRCSTMFIVTYLKIKNVLLFNNLKVCMWIILGSFTAYYVVNRHIRLWMLVHYMRIIILSSTCLVWTPHKNFVVNAMCYCPISSLRRKCGPGFSCLNATKPMVASGKLPSCSSSCPSSLHLLSVYSIFLIVACKLVYLAPGM